MNMQQCEMRNREGFTLVEVITAVVLLSAVLVCLGGLSYHAARQAVNVNNGAGRQALALETVNRLAAMPYTQITATTGTSCDTVTYSRINRYRRCTTVALATRMANVTVTVTPLARGSFPQTFRFQRAQPPGNNPLMMP